MSDTLKSLFKHKAVIASFGAVGFIAAASLAYFLVATHLPSLQYVQAKEAPIHQDVTASGSVEPVQNPDLSFTAGGRVTYVNATVGQEVGAGAVLATLDTGVLSANLAAAQAHLNELENGPRAVDVAGQQTAVSQAQQSLSTAYQTYPTTLSGAVSQASGAVAMTDVYFNDPNTYPQVRAVVANDYQDQQRLDKERMDVNTSFQDLNEEFTRLSATSTPGQLEAASDDATEGLQKAQVFLTDFANVAAEAKVLPSYQEADIQAAVTASNTARNTVNQALATIANAEHSLSSGELSIQSAQNALNLTQAGARPEDIAVAQAQVNAAAATLRQSEIVAPFAGTVGAVAVKIGDVVQPNAVAVSLVPHGTSQVEVQLSELEVAKVAAGDTADITLDAYGSSRTFQGTVASVATAPVAVDGGTPSYKVVIILSQNDPAVVVGMHANVTIHGGSKDQALVVPKSAVIKSGSTSYVLKHTANGDVKTTVTTGLESDDMIEITNGLSAGDQIARVGSGS